jgi:hypothetical protein
MVDLPPSDGIIIPVQVQWIRARERTSAVTERIGRMQRLESARGAGAKQADVNKPQSSRSSNRRDAASGTARHR